MLHIIYVSRFLYKNCKMISLLFLFYTITFFILTIYLARNLKNGWTIQFYFISLLVLFYVIIPISNIIYDFILVEKFIIPDLTKSVINMRYYSYTSFFIFIIFIFCVFIGIKLASKKQYEIIHIEERNINFNNKFKFHIIQLLGIFLALFSLLSMLLYVSQFGGFSNAILQASSVRSGYVEEVAISTKFIFVKRFIYFSLLSLMIYFVIKNKSNFINITVILLVSIITLLISRTLLFSGKESILQIILLFYFYKSIYNNKPYLKEVFFILLALFFLLPLMDLLISLRYNKFDLNNISFDFLKFLGYFSFPQVALEFAINENYTYLYFQDFIFGLRGNIIPNSWLSDWNISTIEQNTYFFKGYFESIVPPGIIAFSFYSFGLLGVILVGTISGFFIKKLDMFFKDFISFNKYYSIFYAYVLTLIYAAVRTGIPKFVFYNTTTIVFILIILTSYKFYKRKIY